MQKLRIAKLDEYQPRKEKILKRKKDTAEEFKRDSSKRNKRVKK